MDEHYLDADDVAPRSRSTVLLLGSVWLKNDDVGDDSDDDDVVMMLC